MPTPSVIATDPQPELPPIEELHRRHPGVTEALCSGYAEAAAVVMDQYHQSPLGLVITYNSEPPRSYVMHWRTPDARERGAWNNADDATRDAAYGVALAVSEVRLGLVAVARTPNRSGADYYVHDPTTDDNPLTDDELDLEDAWRLEVSGMSRTADAREVTRRLNQKLDQLGRGESELRGIACVVAFRLGRAELATP